MFKKSYLLIIFNAFFTSYVQSAPIDVQCNSVQSSLESSFNLLNVYNPRNAATAMLDNIQGNFIFGGVWLHLIESQEGEYSSHYKYKTMNGGELIISKTQILGRGGCGRGECPPKFNNIKAMFHFPVLSNNNEPISYVCSTHLD